MLRRLAPLLSVLPLLFASCRDTSIATYRVPKETQTSAADASPSNANAHATDVPAPGDALNLTWTAPASWQPKPGDPVRKGSYAIGRGAETADLAVTTFPGDVGGNLANVNRWRAQIGLPAISATELPSALTHLDVASLHIDYVELAHNGTRVLAAIVPHADATWFVKLAGPDAVVAAEKPAYIAFLNTLRPAP